MELCQYSGLILEGTQFSLLSKKLSGDTLGLKQPGGKTRTVKVPQYASEEPVAADILRPRKWLE